MQCSTIILMGDTQFTLHTVIRYATMSSQFTYAHYYALCTIEFTITVTHYLYYAQLRCTLKAHKLIDKLMLVKSLNV